MDPFRAHIKLRNARIKVYSGLPDRIKKRFLNFHSGRYKGTWGFLIEYMTTRPAEEESGDADDPDVPEADSDPPSEPDEEGSDADR